MMSIEITEQQQTPLSLNDSNFESYFTVIQQNFTKLKTNISDIQSQLRLVEKKIKTETKPRNMQQTKIVGFDILEKITPELAIFMKIPHEESSTRNNVTKYITNYICINNLQDMNDRKCIKINAELATLFKISIDSKLTYFNIHKYISSLFIR